MTPVNLIQRLSGLKTPSLRAARRPSLALLVAVALSALLSGCIVQSSSTDGVLEVRWSTQPVCSQATSVRIRASRGTVLETEVNGIPCDRGIQALSVTPGIYTVSVEALDATGNVLSSATSTNLNVVGNNTTSTAVLQLGGGAGPGEIQLSWSIAGEGASTGCGKFNLSKVIVSLLDQTQSEVVATAETNCTDGAINLTGVTPGSYYVQVDAATSKGALIWGNAQLTGPVTVASGTQLVLQNTINLVDLRAVITLNWQFSDGATCAAKNTVNVLVEVRDGANKVVVPMSDPYAKKPCDLGPNSAYEARVIDMQFATPTCTIPPGAKGLVICGITEKNIGIAVSALDQSTGQIYLGGSMKVENIPGGKHTAIATPLYLSSCNNSDNICAAP